MPGRAQYVVASRQGLYLVGHDAWRKLAEGNFFGVTVRGPDIYAFQQRPAPEEGADPQSGAILRFGFDGAALTVPEILADGLDHNCHQVDFFDGAFFVVDSGHQRILEFDRQWRRHAEHPIGVAVARRGPDDAHINSFLGRGERIYLMFHNQRRRRPSEIVEFDRTFRELRRISLLGHGCHDIVRLEDGRFLYCNSFAGELALDDGTKIKIDELFTRGLSVGADEIAVGSSLFGARQARAILPGFVTFLDRDYRRLARIYLPAAPTQIRRLDGADLSLSEPR